MRASVAKFAGYGLSLLASLVVVASLVFWNWQEAQPGKDRPAYRLRFFAVPKLQFLKGAKVKESDLRQRVGFLWEGGSYVATPKTAAGQYAAQDLVTGSALEVRQLSDRLTLKPPFLGVIVRSKQEHAAHLRLGMRLVFVSETVSGTLQPGVFVPCLSSGGVELLAINLPAAGSGASLQVATPRENRADILRLSRGDWRPVVVP